MTASSYIRLKPFDAEASMKALTGPALTENVTFTDEAMDEAVTFCMGNPWIIQLLGDSAWNVARHSPVDIWDVKTGADAVRERLNQSFFPRLVRNCSDQEIRLLTVIAEHLVTNGGIFDSIGQLSEVLNIGDIRELRWLLSHLARSDLIEVQHEGLSDMG
jgi:hypothetical protein